MVCEMFIKVKGEVNEEILINLSQVKFIAPRKVKDKVVGSFIDYGAEMYIKSNTTIEEIEKMISDKGE